MKCFNYVLNVQSTNKFYYPFSNQCLYECPENYGGILKDKYECKDVSGKFYDSLTDSYVENCPYMMFEDLKSHKCVYCQELNQLELIYLEKYTCVEFCPENYIQQANSCIECSSNLVYFNPVFNCVSECPFGFSPSFKATLNYSVCQKCEVFIYVIK
jgi:hypothetical protein